jgi:outer membrane protein assembly factor BamB
VTKTAGTNLPVAPDLERYGIAIDDSNVSYWSNQGIFFSVSSVASGFALSSAWPSAGVNVATAAGSLTTPISDLAIDGHAFPYLYAYAAWEKVTLKPLATTVQGVLSAVNMSNGSVVWTVDLPATNLPASSDTNADYGNAAPAVADDGTVYVGNGDGLRAVNPSTGTVTWTFSSADVTDSPAIGGDGTIFFGCKDSSFYAVNPNGTLRFKLVLGAQVSGSPAIASDGTVWVNADDGYLYHIK